MPQPALSPTKGQPVMSFAFLVLPHGSYFCPVRHFITRCSIQPRPVQPLPLSSSPAGSATAPADAPRPWHRGTGGRSPWRAFPGRVASHSRTASQKKEAPGPPARGGPACLIGGNLPMPPNPLWIVYVPDASRPRPHALPTLASSPKTSDLFSPGSAGRKPVSALRPAPKKAVGCKKGSR